MKRVFLFKLDFLIVIIPLLLFFVISKNGYCQSVSGNVVDNSNLPAEVLIDRSNANSANKSSAGQLPRHLAHTGIGSNPSVNDYISRKFEVSRENISSSGGESSSATMSWAVAMGYDTDENANSRQNHYISSPKTGCAAYKGTENNEKEEGLWRLPTQKELILLIMINKKLLNKLDETGYYWTSTEVNTTDVEKGRAWAILFDGGYISRSNEKNSTRFVRCIKDLAP